uniref:Uncharacterized protein n=1 Tax=Canis lupus familiaris TaxID=9615 RepID=A0A8I3MQ63_CANLF
PMKGRKLSLSLQLEPSHHKGKWGTLLHCWWECELVQPLWETVWRFLKELKIDLPYDPAIALLGIYPKDTDAVKRRDTCTPMFIAAMCTIAELWKEPWLNKQKKKLG